MSHTYLKSRLALPTLTVAIGLALSSHASAEALTHASSVKQLDTLVVTATGAQQWIRDAPASISVISREEIERKPVTSIGQLLSTVPGVTGGYALSGAQSKIRLRGLPEQYTLILIDGRRDLPQVRSLCQLLRSTGPGCPLVLVVTEGGLAAVTADWGIDDVLLDTAGPAEVEARLRLAMGRQQITTDDSPMEIRNGDLSVDEATYSAKLKGRILDLTFKEFELLKYLAQHPGRVFTRAQLLQEVWGYDYFGGTRTVDVHVRRLRAKLGPEHESLIGTVRNVGYRFVTPEKPEAKEKAAKEQAQEEAAEKVRESRAASGSTVTEKAAAKP